MVVEKTGELTQSVKDRTSLHVPCLVSERGWQTDCRATPECECLGVGHWGRSDGTCSKHVGARSCSGAHTLPKC